MAEKGIKIKDIANALGVSRPTTSKIANAKMLPSDPKDLQKLCDLFGVETMNWCAMKTAMSGRPLKTKRPRYLARSLQPEPLR